MDSTISFWSNALSNYHHQHYLSTKSISDFNSDESYILTPMKFDKQRVGNQLDYNLPTAVVTTNHLDNSKMSSVSTFIDKKPCMTATQTFVHQSKEADSDFVLSSIKPKNGVIGNSYRSEQCTINSQNYNFGKSENDNSSTDLSYLQWTSPSYETTNNNDLNLDFGNELIFEASKFNNSSPITNCKYEHLESFEIDSNGGQSLLLKQLSDMQSTKSLNDDFNYEEMVAQTQLMHTGQDLKTLNDNLVNVTRFVDELTDSSNHNTDVELSKKVYDRSASLSKMPYLQQQRLQQHQQQYSLQSEDNQDQNPMFNQSYKSTPSFLSNQLQQFFQKSSQSDELKNVNSLMELQTQELLMHLLNNHLDNNTPKIVDDKKTCLDNLLSPTLLNQELKQSNWTQPFKSTCSLSNDQLHKLLNNTILQNEFNASKEMISNLHKPHNMCSPMHGDHNTNSNFHTMYSNCNGKCNNIQNKRIDLIKNLLSSLHLNNSNSCNSQTECNVLTEKLTSVLPSLLNTNSLGSLISSPLSNCNQAVNSNYKTNHHVNTNGNTGNSYSQEQYNYVANALLTLLNNTTTNNNCNSSPNDEHCSPTTPNKSGRNYILNNHEFDNFNTHFSQSTPHKYMSTNKSSSLIEELSQLAMPYQKLLHNFENDIDKAANVYRNSASTVAQTKEAVYHWSGKLPTRVYCSTTYSRKIFLGGVPWDSTGEDLTLAFSRFGNVSVFWPQKETAHLNHLYTKTSPTKGYCYLIFEHESCVADLLQNCVHDPATGGDYYKISSPKFKSKNVQIIPWVISDSQFTKLGAVVSDTKKAIFVGALHGMITAEALVTIMNDLFGNAVFAALDTDKYKYPIGSGRVVFSNDKSYMKAVTANFVDVRTLKFIKTIQIDPYLEDAVCNNCLQSPGMYFCRAFECFRYFCPACWQLWHNSTESLYTHKPLRRTFRPIFDRQCNGMK